VFTWDLPLPLESYSNGGCMNAYMAQEECVWDCPECESKKAFMVKSIEKSRGNLFLVCPHMFPPVSCI
jgi:hypothetical protein